ncbi:ATP-binding SpoIIE family protein phosphatase [Clostridium beijerinckii]|uniref:ATP-binding SpoIIE family protein phosphatase n=1 Tax=Clostridium beijerinckii TaxID=1520 RepID=UPI0022DEDBC0|nr:ATP-binding SpoIIE family protein phosphatase [Clostridium beijerinckii]
MEIFEISNEWDIGQVRRYIAEKGKEIGFSSIEIGEISIVVNELCSNLIKHHSVEGKLIFKRLEMNERVGIEITAEDNGPGILNVDEVIKDGISTKGTMGGGLGATKRLMDSFELYSRTNTNIGKYIGYEKFPQNHGIGTIIITQKWLKSSLDIGKKEVNISVMSRPYLGCKVNGDVYYIKESNNKVIFALIDGLGHGIEANKAAIRAKELLEENNHKSLRELLYSIDNGMKNTRGAVIGVCIIDKDTRSFQYGSIGNVQLRYILNNKTQKFIATNGTLGVSLKTKVNVQESIYENGGIIVMNTDGISNKWEYDDYLGISANNPAALSNIIFRDFARDNDDATVLVAVI